MPTEHSKKEPLEDSWSRLEDSLVALGRGLEELGRKLEARGGSFLKVIVIDTDEPR